MKLSITKFEIKSTTGFGALQRRGNLKWKGIAFFDTSAARMTGVVGLVGSGGADFE